MTLSPSCTTDSGSMLSLLEASRHTDEMRKAGMWEGFEIN
jgi:hypothetical protein